MTYAYIKHDVFGYVKTVTGFGVEFDWLSGAQAEMPVAQKMCDELNHRYKLMAGQDRFYVSEK